MFEIPAHWPQFRYGDPAGCPPFGQTSTVREFPFGALLHGFDLDGFDRPGSGGPGGSTLGGLVKKYRPDWKVLIVEREKAIRAFEPEDYLEVAATFEAPAGPAMLAVGRDRAFPGYHGDDLGPFLRCL